MVFHPIIPHDNDILMGRGGKNNQHSGNEKLRQVCTFSQQTKKTKWLLLDAKRSLLLLLLHSPLSSGGYQLARLEAKEYNTSSKKGKSKIAKGLVAKVRQMQPAGRFLKRNPVTSDWEGMCSLHDTSDTMYCGCC